MSETDIKNLLLDRLKLCYDGFMCEMAALYQAAQQTVLTVSQIQQMSFDDVKARLGQTLGLDSVNVKKENDVDLIEVPHHHLLRRRVPPQIKSIRARLTG